QPRHRQLQRHRPRRRQRRAAGREGVVFRGVAAHEDRRARPPAYAGLDEGGDILHRRYDHPKRADPSLQQAQRLAENRREPAHLAAAAAGKHDQHQGLGRDAVLGAKAGAIAGAGAAVDYRVTDAGGRQPLALEIRRLERQQRQQMVVPACDPPRPAAAPRPDHRCDIMDQRQGLAGAAEAMGDAPGETRAVDRHHRIGLGGADRGDRLAHVAEDRPRPRQNLGNPGDGEVGERHEAFESLLRHPLAADAGDLEVAAGSLLERRDQRTADRIARRLAGDDIDENHSRTRTPTTKMPAASAARATSSRSSSSTAPASAAIPRSPASAATETVRGPSVGRSTRLSCPGFSALTSTPPGPGRCKPAQRRTSASVPSIASTPSTMPCWTTTDWPISSAPTARAMRSPCAISASARGSGTSAPTGPSGIAAVSAKSWSGPITRKPSLSISLITAERSPSSPRARSPIRAKNLAARQSGRSEAIDGRCTPPARTSSPTPLARSRSKPAAAAPIRHQACGTSATVSGSASPSSARTKTARPSLRHFSITRRGNPPLPATMPSGPAPLAVIRPFGLADRPARIGANERDHIVDRADPGKLRGRLLDPLAEGAAAVGEQELIGGAQTLDVVAAEPAALHSDDVEAGQPGAVAHHQPIWDHVALDPGHAADHRVPPDAHELMHRRQPAEDRVILDHHVA